MNNLKQLRKSKGLTQKKIAKVLNVAPTTYLGYEKGINEPNIKTLIKLADYFNTTIDEIVGHKPKNIDSKKLELYNNIMKLEESVIDNLSKCIEGFVIAQELKERFTKEENK